MLYIFSGLPGVGKTSLAQLLSKELKAIHLRVDVIENELIQWGIEPINDLGYRISYSLAREHLKLGLNVIADTVNPIEITRFAWRQVAIDLNKSFLEIEVVCSDINEHKLRVESRKSDLTNFTLPSWNDVVEREYEANPVLRIDTAKSSLEESFLRLKSLLEI